MAKLSSLLGFRKPKQIELEDYISKLKTRGLDETGKTVPDPTPIAPPIGYKKQPSMVEIVRDMVRSERLAQEARASDHETFEEADDFDVGDDNAQELRSGWENDHDPPIQEMTKAGAQEVERKARAQKSDPPATPPAKKAETPPEGS